MNLEISTSGLAPGENDQTRQIVESLGGTFARGLTESTKVLIMKKADNQSAKFKAAEKLGIPIVLPSWLSASYKAKAAASFDDHRLLPLSGWKLNCEGVPLSMRFRIESKIRSMGGELVSFDLCGLAIIADSFDPLAQLAKQRSLPVATPDWVENLEICPRQKTTKLPSMASLVSFTLQGNARETLCSTQLVGCVIYVGLLPSASDRVKFANLSVTCGAFSTDFDSDPAISHILVPPGCRVASMPIVRPSRLVIGVQSDWLERCVACGVPVEDSEFSVEIQWKAPAVKPGQPSLRRSETAIPSAQLAIPAKPSLQRSKTLQPRDTEVKVRSSGVFFGRCICILGFSGPEERVVTHQLAANGATLVENWQAADAIVLGDSEPLPGTSDLASPLNSPNSLKSRCFSSRWVRACVESDKYLDTANCQHFAPCRTTCILHRPSSGKLPIPLAKDVHIYSCEKSDADSELIRELAAACGFRASTGNKVALSSVSHFLFASKASALRRKDLTSLAGRRKIWVLSLDWLKECFATGSRASESKFVMNTGFTSESAGAEKDYPEFLTGKLVYLSPELNEDSVALADSVQTAGGQMLQTDQGADVVVKNSFELRWLEEMLRQGRWIAKENFSEAPVPKAEREGVQWDNGMQLT